LGFGLVTEWISHFGEGSKPRHFGFGRGVAPGFGLRSAAQPRSSGQLILGRSFTFLWCCARAALSCAALAPRRSEPDSFVPLSRNTVLRRVAVARCDVFREGGTKESARLPDARAARSGLHWAAAYAGGGVVGHLKMAGVALGPGLGRRWASQDGSRSFRSVGIERARRLLARCAGCSRRNVRPGNVQVRFLQELAASVCPQTLVRCGKVALWKGAGESAGQDWAEAWAGADRGSDTGGGSGGCPRQGAGCRHLRHRSAHRSLESVGGEDHPAAANYRTRVLRDGRPGRLGGYRCRGRRSGQR
jgi:hypothetical protein